MALVNGYRGFGAAVDIRGNLDAVDCKAGTVNGWAQDQSISGKAQVDIYVDAKFVGQIHAASFRADLKAAKVGDGTHAFAWKIPDALRDNQPHAVEAKVGSRTLGTKTIQCPPRSFFEKYGLIVGAGAIGYFFLKRR